MVPNLDFVYSGYGNRETHIPWEVNSTNHMLPSTWDKILTSLDLLNVPC